MSRAASPFTGRYGVVRVTREWEMARSSFYYQREIAAAPGRVLGRRGPKTAWSDAQQSPGNSPITQNVIGAGLRFQMG